MSSPRDEMTIMKNSENQVKIAGERFKFETRASQRDNQHGGHSTGCGDDSANRFVLSSIVHVWLPSNAGNDKPAQAFVLVDNGCYFAKSAAPSCISNNGHRMATAMATPFIDPLLLIRAMDFAHPKYKLDTEE